MSASPALASCAGLPQISPYAFTGTVVATGHSGRLARVLTDQGRVVTVTGTPDLCTAATSVDRRYKVGGRYEFHPRNAGSPYRDDACTATRLLDPGLWSGVQQP